MHPRQLANETFIIRDTIADNNACSYLQTIEDCSRHLLGGMFAAEVGGEVVIG
jgi:hypothetical protein